MDEHYHPAVVNEPNRAGFNPPFQEKAMNHPASIACAAALVLSVSNLPVTAADWPQWRGPTRDGHWSETGLVTRFSKPQLDLLWKAEIGSGYSGPTVADGRVYVSDRVVTPGQSERVHCFDAATGAKVWTHEYRCEYRGVNYDAGPRASVLVHDGRAYALGAMGDLHCFDAARGNVHWRKELVTEYAVEVPIWGLSASPLIEGNLLIAQVGGKGATLVAWDRITGKERWRALDDPPSYSAPIAIDQAGRRVVVVYTGASVAGVDAGSGEILWKHPFPARKMIIGIATPVVQGDLLFLTNFFDGSLLLRLGKNSPTVEQVWKRAGEDERNTDALHSIISTPFMRDGYIFGVDSYGELRCLDAANGDRVWESRDAVPRARWATIHFVENGDNVWMFNERGELIIARLSREGYQELSRAKLIEPTLEQLRERDGVCWSHPAFADRCVFARNDKELVCASLAAKPND